MYHGESRPDVERGRSVERGVGWEQVQEEEVNVKEGTMDGCRYA